MCTTSFLVIPACSDDGGETSNTDAPTISNVIPMAGGLHVIWTHPSNPCDTIEGERKSSESSYESAFVVPGEFDNKHDAAATGDVEYTYRLRCKRGDSYSEYSNEMSGNPTS